MVEKFLTSKEKKKINPEDEAMVHLLERLLVQAKKGEIDCLSISGVRHGHVIMSYYPKGSYLACLSSADLLMDRMRNNFFSEVEKEDDMPTPDSSGKKFLN